jgi:hypothetical protein
MSKKQLKLVELSDKVGYNHFHADWYINNKQNDKSWLLEMCLLQQWLRDNYDADIEIRHTHFTEGDSSTKTYYHQISINSIPNQYVLHIDTRSYEYALGEGLKEILEQIIANA